MSRWDRRPVRYAVYLAIWSAFGGFFFTQDLSRKLFFDDPTPWWQYLVSWMIGVWLQAALTPATLALGRRWPIVRAGWPRRVALHAVCSVGLAGVHLLVQAVIAPQVGFLGPVPVDSVRAALGILLVVSVHNNIVSYWIVLGVQHGLRTYRQYQERVQQALRLELHTSELENQLVRARLGALKMQLQPHFLFNTMNAIMVLVRQQRGAEAEETIARLSDLLRFVLDDALAQEVPLSRELAYLKLYLSIEQLRFADRLRVEIDADPAVTDAAVPHMALQPLVENAVRHGISALERGGTIRVTARRAGEALVLEVIDDGPGPGAAAPSARLDAHPRRGIGLENTRARLRQLYGARASLSLTAATPSGTIARITLPYHLVPEGEPEDEFEGESDGEPSGEPASDAEPPERGRGGGPAGAVARGGA